MSKSIDASPKPSIIYSSDETILSFAAIGEQFMDRMEEYMEVQDTPDFDVQQHLMELYEDLSNLYNDNINE